jgi:hypothetical protein
VNVSDLIALERLFTMRVVEKPRQSMEGLDIFRRSFAKRRLRMTDWIGCL